MDWSCVMQCNDKHTQYFSQKPKEMTPFGAQETGERDVLKRWWEAQCGMIIMSQLVLKIPILVKNCCASVV